MLNRPPARTPLVDPRTGLITREWFWFLEGVYAHLGGSTGSSTPDLSASAFEDAGVEEVKSGLYDLRDELRQAPPMPQAATGDDSAGLLPPVPTDMAGNEADGAAYARLAALEAEGQVLRSALQDLQQSTVI